MNGGHIYSACATHPDHPSPNIHLTVLKLRVPHLFSSRRRPSRPRNLAIMPQSASTNNRTVELSIIMDFVGQNLDGRQGNPNAPHSRRPLMLRQLDCYQVGILTHHLLATKRNDADVERRWQELLQKIEAAFKAANPSHVSHVDAAGANPYDSLDRWIEEAVPRHVQLIRDAYAPGSKEAQELVNLIESLENTRKNLKSLARSMPTDQQGRLKQLDNLMARIMMGLERQQRELSDGLPRVEPSHLSQLADIANEGDFSDFAHMCDLSYLSSSSLVVDPEGMLASCVHPHLLSADAAWICSQRQ
ncbi:hypothetical protein C8Q73DRAFT_716295 [Cubamyces lactineus]|nr:hypothetical protein C8Q73DRAFT_716295 [Cubamyces lactineus]